MDSAEQFISSMETCVDMNFEPIPVLPGDDVTDTITRFRDTIVIGNGLDRVRNRVVSRLGGLLKYKPPATYWVELLSTKIYLPKTSDHVIGIIEERGGEYYRVNIFSGSIALLDRLAFEGATKRNKPELKRGDVIYARVSMADKDLETTLTCVSSSGPQKDWSSGESVFGELGSGILVRVSISHCRKMLLPDCAVLNALARFEVAVGMNGAVWLRAGSAPEAVVIRNAILNSQILSDLEAEAMVEKLAQMAKRFKKN